jgi:hypothetical protein
VLYARRAALSDLVNGNAALSAELTLRIASSREALLAMTPRNPVGTGLQILLESWAFASRPGQWIPLCLPADHTRSATGGMVCDAPKQRSMRFLVTDGPHVIWERGKIGLGELGATHWRHHTGVFLGLRYAMSDRAGNRLDAAIAP